MMGGLGEGLAILAVILLIGKIWAAWRILERIEVNKFAALAILFPIVGEAILLWWLAFARWPRDEELDASDSGYSSEDGALWDPGSIGSTDVTTSDERRPPAP
ncbi:MAG: hypothetical protein NXI16_14635 [Alphaproteobacteria bacterium]|nr:hypothetical protein [Alphaproteobacteria bacterium]